MSAINRCDKLLAWTDRLQPKRRPANTKKPASAVETLGLSGYGDTNYISIKHLESQYT